MSVGTGLLSPFIEVDPSAAFSLAFLQFLRELQLVSQVQLLLLDDVNDLLILVQDGREASVLRQQLADLV